MPEAPQALTKDLDRSRQLAFALSASLGDQPGHLLVGFSGSVYLKERSANSHLRCQIPRRWANGAKICSVSRAMRIAPLRRQDAPGLRMLCSRSAILMTTTRRSARHERKTSCRFSAPPLLRLLPLPWEPRSAEAAISSGAWSPIDPEQRHPRQTARGSDRGLRGILHHVAGCRR